MIEAKDAVAKYASAPNSSALLDEILADEGLLAELRALGVAKEEIPQYVSLLASYEESQKICQACKGLDRCASPTPQLIPALAILDSGRLGLTLGPCRFAKDRASLLADYLFRDYPDEWLSLSLRSFRNQRANEVKKALSSALRDEAHPWVYLRGGSGVGKSFFLAAFANDLALRGRTVAFLNANKRFDELKSLAITDRPAFEQAMAALEGSALLVIDDFGSEYKSDYVRDQVVMPLLGERSKKRLPVFFGSRYTLEEIQDLYGASSRSGLIVAKQLVGLIRGNIAGETVLPKGLDSYLH
jgi:primosomal protein DnaI